MRPTKGRLLAIGVLPLLLLTACGDGDKNGSAESSADTSTSSTPPTSTWSTAPKATGPATSISKASVDTSKANAPAVKLAAKPFHVNKTTTKVVKPGTGTAIGANDIATVAYAVVNGSSGKTVESSFGKQNVGFYMGETGTLPGLLTAIKGQKAGAEVIAAIPPGEGFGAQGNEQAQVGPNDTLVFYLKIVKKAEMLKGVTGTQAASKAGLPTVKVPAGANKQATITTPKGAKAPTTLQTQTLIKGKGEKITAGQTLYTNYTGAIWGTNTVFDASAKTKEAAAFAIGVQRVIPGWDKALVGQTVGSRVLIVVPPAEGYGPEGQPQAGIKGTDTLMFVVDIYGAA